MDSPALVERDCSNQASTDRWFPGDPWSATAADTVRSVVRLHTIRGTFKRALHPQHPTPAARMVAGSWLCNSRLISIEVQVISYFETTHHHLECLENVE